MHLEHGKLRQDGEDISLQNNSERLYEQLGIWIAGSPCYLV